MNTSPITHNGDTAEWTQKAGDPAMQQGICDGITDCLKGNRYQPGVDACAENAGYLDGYSHGWNVAWRAATIDHAYAVRLNGGHGYPYRAMCPCGWQSTTYAAAHAAHTMGEDHVTAQAMESINSARRAK